MKIIKEINENLIYFQFFQLLLQNGDITLSWKFTSVRSVENVSTATKV